MRRSRWTICTDAGNHCSLEHVLRARPFVPVVACCDHVVGCIELISTISMFRPLDRWSCSPWLARGDSHGRRRHMPGSLFLHFLRDPTHAASAFSEALHTKAAQRRSTQPAKDLNQTMQVGCELEEVCMNTWVKCSSMPIPQGPAMQISRILYHVDLNQLISRLRYWQSYWARTYLEDTAETSVLGLFVGRCAWLAGRARRDSPGFK